MKLAPIARRILLLKEDGESPGQLELRRTPIDKAIQYIEEAGIEIEDLQGHLEIAYDLFNMGKTKRADMPVIDDKDVRDFQMKLKDGFIDLTDPFSDRTDPTDPFPQGLTDKAATNFMSNGIRDKTKPDDQVQTQIKMIAAKDLIPIQQQVYISKSVDSIAKFGVDASKKFLNSSILVVSKDNRIIDGHHRFLSALIIDPEFKLKCLQIDLSIKTLLPLAISYSDAIGNRRNL